MTSWTETMYKYLLEEPKARERKNKNRAIGNLLGIRYGKPIYNEADKSVKGFDHYELKVTRQVMADLIGECLTADRAWRKVLEENPDLRGSDYSNKDELETAKKQELGYNVK